MNCDLYVWFVMADCMRFLARRWESRGLRPSFWLRIISLRWFRVVGASWTLHEEGDERGRRLGVLSTNQEIVFRVPCPCCAGPDVSRHAVGAKFASGVGSSCCCCSCAPLSGSLFFIFFTSFFSFSKHFQFSNFFIRLVFFCFHFFFFHFFAFFHVFILHVFFILSFFAFSSFFAFLHFGHFFICSLIYFFCCPAPSIRSLGFGLNSPQTTLTAIWLV